MYAYRCQSLIRLVEDFGTATEIIRADRVRSFQRREVVTEPFIFGNELPDQSLRAYLGSPV